MGSPLEAEKGQTSEPVHISGQRKLNRPDGLRTGSPPSPSPQLIRPSVRLLLRSPRFWVRVPFSPYAASLGSVDVISAIF